MDSTEKILIVGAGPVGLTLAVELHRRHIPFSIIDKADGPAPLHESRALAFNSRSQSILSSSGITDKIKSAGHEIQRVNICWNGQVRNTVGLSANTKPSGQLIICPQGRIERVLMSQLEQQQISIDWNTELKDYSEEKNHIRANLLGGDNQVITQSARFIVGCDGAHSMVRKQGAYSFDGETDQQVWTLADISVKDDRFKHTLTADLRPGKAFATMPMDTQRVRLIHNGPNLLTNHPFSHLSTQVHWESDFKVSYRLVKQYSRGRTFLCGDAAHIHSPVGGRGMNLGIEDAATLAYLLAQKREHEYSDLRRPVAKQVLKMTHQQTAQMNASSWLSSMLKQVGPKLIHLPPVKKKFLRNIYGLDTAEPEWL